MQRAVGVGVGAGVDSDGGGGGGVASPSNTSGNTKVPPTTAATPAALAVQHPHAVMDEGNSSGSSVSRRRRRRMQQLASPSVPTTSVPSSPAEVVATPAGAASAAASAATAAAGQRLPSEQLSPPSALALRPSFVVAMPGAPPPTPQDQTRKLLPPAGPVYVRPLPPAALSLLQPQAPQPVQQQHLLSSPSALSSSPASSGVGVGGGGSSNGGGSEGVGGGSAASSSSPPLRAPSSSWSSTSPQPQPAHPLPYPAPSPSESIHGGGGGGRGSAGPSSSPGSDVSSPSGGGGGGGETATAAAIGVTSRSRTGSGGAGSPTSCLDLLQRAALENAAAVGPGAARKDEDASVERPRRVAVAMPQLQPQLAMPQQQQPPTRPHSRSQSQHQQRRAYPTPQPTPLHQPQPSPPVLPHPFPTNAPSTRQRLAWNRQQQTGAEQSDYAKESHAKKVITVVSGGAGATSAAAANSPSGDDVATNGALTRRPPRLHTGESGASSPGGALSRTSTTGTIESTLSKDGNALGAEWTTEDGLIMEMDPSAGLSPKRVLSIVKNDPSQNAYARMLVRTCPRFMLRSVLGVRLASWLLLVFLLLVGVVGSSYLLVYNQKIIDRYLESRYAGACLQQTQVLAERMASMFERQEYLAAYVAAQRGTGGGGAEDFAAVPSIDSLQRSLYPPSSTVMDFSTLHYALRVNASMRAQYEAAHGPILAWDASTGTLRNASWSGSNGSTNSNSSSVVRADNSTFQLGVDVFYPVLVYRDAALALTGMDYVGGGVVGRSSSTGRANGFALPLNVDLASLPGMAAALADMERSEEAQLSRPFYAGNYSDPVSANGLAPADAASGAPLWQSDTEDDSSASYRVVDAEHGYRMLMLSPARGPASPSASSSSTMTHELRGALLSSFDLSPVLRELRVAPLLVRSMPESMEDAMAEVFLPAQGAVTISMRRSPASEAELEEEEDGTFAYSSRVVLFDEDVTASALAGHYIDARQSSLHSSHHDGSNGGMHVSWSLGPFLPLASSSDVLLDWVVSYHASSSGGGTPPQFVSLQTLRYLVCSLLIAFIVLAVLLLFVLLRWHNLIMLERAHKARVLAAMQEARRQAEAARDSKTDFMAFLCHELRNPLHAVLCMADSLRETPLDPEQTDAVFTIHASSELMLCITNDILDLSKIESGKIELEMLDIDLYALLDSLVRANNSHGQERGVSVTGRIDPRVPRYICADPTRLNQILTNLLSNGVKFSRKHGEVILEVELEETPMAMAGEGEAEAMGTEGGATGANATGGNAMVLREGGGGAGATTGGATSGSAPEGILRNGTTSSGALASATAPAKVNVQDMLRSSTLNRHHGGVGGGGGGGRGDPPSPRSIAHPSVVHGPTPEPPSILPGFGMLGPDRFLGPAASPAAGSMMTMPTSGMTGGILLGTVPARKRSVHHTSAARRPSLSQVEPLQMLQPGQPPLSAVPRNMRNQSPEAGYSSGGGGGNNSPRRGSFSALHSGGGGGGVHPFSVEGSAPMSGPTLHSRISSGSGGIIIGSGGGASEVHTPFMSGPSGPGSLERRRTHRVIYPSGSPAMELSSLFGAGGSMAPPATNTPERDRERERERERGDRGDRGKPLSPLSSPATTTRSKFFEFQPVHSPKAVVQQQLSSAPQVSSSSSSSQLPARNPVMITMSSISNNAGAGAGAGAGMNTGNTGAGNGGGGNGGSSGAAGGRGDMSDVASISHRRNVTRIGVAGGGSPVHSPAFSARAVPPLHPSSRSLMSSPEPPFTPSARQRGLRASTRSNASVNGVGAGRPNESPLLRPSAATNAAAALEASPIALASNNSTAVPNGASASSSVAVQLPGRVRLVFRVTDSGTGIPADYMPQLFTAYSQAKRSITRSHGGTGLGLAIVKKLADLMHATITVDSVVDEGTTFALAADFEAVPPPAERGIAQLMQELPKQVLANQQVARYANYTTLSVPSVASAANSANNSGTNSSDPSPLNEVRSAHQVGVNMSMGTGAGAGVGGGVESSPSDMNDEVLVPAPARPAAMPVPFVPSLPADVLHSTPPVGRELYPISSPAHGSQRYDAEQAEGIARGIELDGPPGMVAPPSPPAIQPLDEHAHQQQQQQLRTGHLHVHVSAPSSAGASAASSSSPKLRALQAGAVSTGFEQQQQQQQREEFNLPSPLNAVIAAGTATNAAGHDVERMLSVPSHQQHQMQLNMHLQHLQQADAAILRSVSHAGTNAEHSGGGGAGTPSGNSLSPSPLLRPRNPQTLSPGNATTPFGLDSATRRSRFVLQKSSSRVPGSGAGAADAAAGSASTATAVPTLTINAESDSPERQGAAGAGGATTLAVYTAGGPSSPDFSIPSSTPSPNWLGQHSSLVTPTNAASVTVTDSSSAGSGGGGASNRLSGSFLSGGVTRASSTSMMPSSTLGTPQPVSRSATAHLLSVQSQAAPSPASFMPCVLVVDDSSINRKIMLKALGSSYRVEQAENGLEAVQMVEANPTRYCCVLMDLMMPVKSGTDALLELRASGYTLPIIAVTANTMSEDVETCLRIGFTAFLSKPCRAATVRAKIAEICGPPEQHIAQAMAHAQHGQAGSEATSAAVSTMPSPNNVSRTLSTVSASGASGATAACLTPVSTATSAGRAVPAASLSHSAPAAASPASQQQYTQQQGSALSSSMPSLRASDIPVVAMAVSDGRDRVIQITPHPLPF